MVQKNVLIHASFLCLLVLLSAHVRADGDPVEFVGEAQELQPDEQLETAEDAIATVTADGEFLLPSYIVPTEPLKNTASEKTAPRITTEKRSTVPVGRTIKTTTVRTEYVPADAEVLAKLGIPPPSTPVLLDMGKPVSMPQGGASSAPALNEQRQMERPKAKKPLLIPIATEAEIVQEEDMPLPVSNRPALNSAYADRILEDFTQNGTSTLMPHEMKVTFYPGEASFSGHSLKWIRAFSNAAMYDPRLVLEIRMSRNEMPLQYKRLAILQNALTGAGLSTHQMQVSFVNRPTDTLLLRNIKRPEPTEVIQKNTQKKVKKQTKAVKW